jgi:hypothetical protein
LLIEKYGGSNGIRAFLLMDLLLADASIKIAATQGELYEFIIGVINNRPSLEAISTWIEQKSNLQ